MFKKDAATQPPDEIISRIIFTADYTLLKDADFIVENVTEKWDVKKEVYFQIDKIAPEHCIFAANTSAISITRIGSATKRFKSNRNALYESCSHEDYG